MPAKLVFTPAAEGSLQNIADYIAIDNPTAARQFALQAQERCASLRDFPQLGRVYNHTYRVLTEGSYLIFYRVTTHEDTQLVTIMLVVHGARDLGSII